MIFEYDEQKVFTKSVDIVDCGNFCLRCSTDNMLEYYIIVKTVMGKTIILKFGPVVPDTPIFANGFSLLSKQLDFKESKIASEINSYINDSKKSIEMIEEITQYEALQAFPNLEESLANID